MFTDTKTDTKHPESRSTMIIVSVMKATSKTVTVSVVMTRVLEDRLVDSRSIMIAGIKSVVYPEDYLDTCLIGKP